MFDYPGAVCSSPSTPPTGWSSSSRRGAGAVLGGRGGAAPLRARAARRRRSRARCSRRRRAGRAARVARRVRRARRRRATRTSCSRTRRSSSSTSRRPGSRRASARICEIGAVRVRGARARRTRSRRSSHPGVPLPRADRPADRDSPTRSCGGRRASRSALRRFSAFAGDAVLVAHNARFDVGFVNREVERLTGRAARGAGDRHGLARAQPAARARRADEPRLARVLLRRVASSRATARCPTRRRPPRSSSADRARAGARRADRRRARGARGAEAAARARQALARRTARPTRPGVYLFRDRHGQVLYVGKARDLRARLRSYFPSERQRPAVEAALGAVERIEWRVLGSELAAALEEVRLIRELRPPANARSRAAGAVRLPAPAGGAGGSHRDADAPRPDPESSGGCSLQRARSTSRRWTRSPVRCRLSARSWDGLARDLRFEDAARLRDRVAALEEVAARVDELERLRAWELCILVPAREHAFWRAFIVAHGRVARRNRSARSRRPARAGGGLAAVAGRRLARARGRRRALVVAGVLRRPAPELRIEDLELAEILAA